MDEHQIPKAYHHKDVEKRIYHFWEEQNAFTPSAKAAKSKKKFSIPMPPPNVTGRLHLGHAATLTYEDAMIRFHRMRGDDTVWFPGTDHAGIATQARVDKHLREQGIKREEIGREAFINHVWEWKGECHANIVEQTKSMGASCDWSRERFTLDEGLSAAVSKVFCDAHKKGLIYQGEYIVNYDTENDTVISDLEIHHKEVESKLYYIRYFIKAADRSIVVATTRPETMLGDTAIAVHPEDKRYKDVIGKTAILPIVNREIPVIADERIDPDFGTGAVKITPAHDPNDFAIGQDHHLPIISVIGRDGCMTKEAGQFEGQTVEDARENIAIYLDNIGNLEKIRKHTNNVGFCERSDKPVQFLVSKQWFMHMKPLAEKALKAVDKGELKFVPERFDKTFRDWLENIHDWCISRQLWWGHRIPAYYDDRTGGVVVSPDSLEKLEKKHKTTLRQDEDVLDTWFSSALWPFSVTGWPKKTEDFSKYYPNSVLETGYDIIFFWVARMVMMGIFATGEVPFHTVYFHGMIRDEQGRKMTKSLDNGIDPMDIIAEYGADTLRMTLTLGSTPGNDLKFSKSKVEGNKHFINKLWNASRFIRMKSPDTVAYSTLHKQILKDIGKYDVATRWMLSRLATITEQTTHNLETYNFSEAGLRLYDFTWNEFCDWYIEISKALPGKYVPAVLQYAMMTLLQLWHPFIPFVTEAIWETYTQRTPLITHPWPKTEAKWIQPKIEEDFHFCSELVRIIRNLRQESNVEAKAHVTVSLLPGDKEKLLTSMLPILSNLVRAKEIKLIKRRPTANLDITTGVLPPVEVFLSLKGVIDEVKERARLQKEVEKATNTITIISAKLANKGFTDKAPKEVVQEQKLKLKTEQERKATLEAQLQRLT